MMVRLSFIGLKAKHGFNNMSSNYMIISEG